MSQSARIDLDPLDDTTVILNPQVVELRQTVADAMTRGRPGYFQNSVDLTSAISDIVFTLTVQGASYLDVVVIDPNWQLLDFVPPGQKHAFIDLDDNGFLIPIVLEFPKGSDKLWRLCAAKPTSDLTAGNVTLTFEDQTTQVLRNLDKSDGGPSISTVNETRLEFITSLTNHANIKLKEVFSKATQTFETSPSKTPSQVAAWDKWWTASQQQRQAESEAVKDALEAEAAALAKTQQWIGSLYSGGSSPSTKGTWWSTQAASF